MKKRKLFTVMAYQWKEETNSKLLYGSNISYLVFTYKIELILYLEHNQKRHDFNKNIALHQNPGIQYSSKYM